MSLGSKKQSDINHRRKLVAAFRLNHVNEDDIAIQLGVSQSTISRDIEVLNKKWIDDSQQKITQIKARELAELDYMELEAAKIIQRLLTQNKKAATQFKEKDLNMALRYSAHRLDIKDRRAKMLGLYEPTKLEMNDVTDKDEAPLTPEVVAARHELLKAIANAHTSNSSRT